MLNTASSQTTMFRFGFRLLLLICCIIAITSYKIDHHRNEARNKRAVTEWRFRRNFLHVLPYFNEQNDASEDLPDGETVDNDNEYGIKAYDKKYVPNLSHDRIY